MVIVNFLGIGKWLSSVLDGVMGTMEVGIRTLCFSLCTFIYQAIIYVYNIFDKLCKGRFLDSEVLQAFSERIGLILGLVMAFIVIFSLIKMVLDPDKITDKEMGATSLIKKIVLVVVMLGVSNYVFNALYTVQKVIIEQDIISKLLLPVQIDESTSNNFGNILSEELFVAFYQIESFKDSDSVPSEVTQCENIYDEFRNQIIKNGNFSLGYECLNQSVEVDSIGESSETFVINYNWLLSVIVGVVVVYLLFSYCISVGVRMIQLMFLEIISPMAIVSYLQPKKDTMFSKWTKIYVSTYIDVFIRIAIINFVVFIIATIFSSGNSFVFWGSIGGEPESSLEKGFITAIIIIALLTFAKKAPDLLKDLFPAGASKLGLGINSPKQMFDGMLGGNVVKSGAKAATVGTAIGLAGAVTSGISRYKINKAQGNGTKRALIGAAGGVFSAYGRGLRAGVSAKGLGDISKGISNQKGIDDKYDELITGGGSSLGVLRTKVGSHFGETSGQTYTRKIRNNEAVVKANEDIKNLAENFSKVKKAKTAWENAKARGAEAHVLDGLFAAYKQVRKDEIDKALSGVRFTDAEDASYAAQITVHKNDIGNLVKSGQVDLKLSSGAKLTDVERQLTSADEFNTISVNASVQISDIKKKDDYNAAIANDRAAGINSNASKK